MIRWRVLTALVCTMALATSTAMAEPPRKVARALVPILAGAEAALKASDPAEALRLLATWDGAPDALHALLTGHAHYHANQIEKAEGAYRQAMKLDATLKQAPLGLARALVDRAAWREAAQVLGQVVRVDEASAPELGLYARVAYELRDLRLASLLVERGILRFPADETFRRLDVAILLERGDLDEAYEAAWSFLTKNPQDALAWRQLAVVTERSKDTELRLATLEAAMLANDSDRRLRRSHMMAQFEAGHTGPALEMVDEMIARSGVTDVSLIELGVRIADDAGEIAKARKWLAKVPAGQRTEALHLLDARMAVRSGEPGAASVALDRLIAAGKASATVFLWAGQLAEQTRDTARAEALYHQASDQAGPSGRLAVLYLARLLHKIDQPNRATQLLATYLAEHPDDTPARSLLAVISQRKAPPRR